jgi:epoxyqueuosine reductase QueG
MSLLKNQIKELCIQRGADIVGIASVDRFTDAPSGSHPKDIMANCESVLVLCCEFPKDSINHDAATYTKARNEMTSKMNKLAQMITKDIKSAGSEAKAIGSIVSSFKNGRNRGPISLKHAAVLAGFGKSCILCIKNRPTLSLGGKLMDQRACAKHAFKRMNGVLEIQCWKCRQICPNNLGKQNKARD